ncbi:hypothetical protein ACLI4Z_11840 [Natrialbaceae archaeon A-arb3/5]
MQLPQIPRSEETNVVVTTNGVENNRIQKAVGADRRSIVDGPPESSSDDRHDG